MNTKVFISIENKETPLVQLYRLRSGKEFCEMQLLEVIKGTGKKTNPTVLVFENPTTRINRDLIIFNGYFYCTDVYNGLLDVDRNNIQYIYPMV